MAGRRQLGSAAGGCEREIGFIIGPPAGSRSVSARCGMSLHRPYMCIHPAAPVSVSRSAAAVGTRMGGGLLARGGGERARVGEVRVSRLGDSNASVCYSGRSGAVRGGAGVVCGGEAWAGPGR